MSFLEATFPVGKFMCTLLFSEKGMEAQWVPCQPKVGDLTAQNLEDYRKHRNDFIKRVEKLLGKKILVVDV